ncbi:MAG: hypothetical protein JWM95_1801 [Gemmatimonadetes bacterium]|nr:hypothetical protein [Gemmatimonadota bacterium]
MTAAVLLTAAVAASATADLFPRMDIRIAEMLLLAIVLVVSNVAYQLHLGRRYALLNVYSGIFFSEFVVGTLVATARGDVLNKHHLSTDAVTTGLGIALGGYVILLIGYHLPSLIPWARPRRSSVDARPTTATDFPLRYRVVLFLMLALTIGLGFIQLAIRVQHAGGFAAYLAVAYTLRYGTYADTDASNAWAVLASLMAAGALPSAALLYVAWMRGRLSGIEKWLIALLTVVLLARQASTAFRAVVVFTLISAFAVYDSERRVGWRKLAVGGVLIVVALVGVNYVHVLLHTLTGVGTTTSFSDASEELMAPHAYLETLTTLVDARARLDPLRGEGMLTSILYFVPRAIWTSKVPSDNYGTGLVQGWAGLTTTYQMAVTNVGELFVHFGSIGLVAMLAWGLIYRWLDDRWWHGMEWRIVLLCISVPRVFPDQGMGLSAFMISLTSVAGFIIPLIIAKRLAGLPAQTPAPE